MHTKRFLRSDIMDIDQKILIIIKDRFVTARDITLELGDVCRNRTFKRLQQLRRHNLVEMRVLESTRQRKNPISYRKKYI